MVCHYEQVGIGRRSNRGKFLILLQGQSNPVNYMGKFDKGWLFTVIVYCWLQFPCSKKVFEFDTEDNQNEL